MKQLMIVTADHNDADYVTEISYVSKEQLQFIKSIIPKLIKKSYGGYSWETQDRGNPHTDYKDILTEEEIDNFDGYIPYAEYGVHTIESIKIYNVESEEIL